MGVSAFSRPRRLRDDDNLDGFSCGAELVDSWLRQRAKGAKRAGTAVVYVSFAGEQLAGFYTLSAQSVMRSQTGGWIARNAPEQVPAILLGMFGVDTRFQGCGLGRDLLLDAVHRSLAIAEQIGSRALIVDPIDEASRAFYAKHHFKPLPKTGRLFLKLC